MHKGVPNMKCHVKGVTLPKSASNILPPSDFWGKLAQALGLKQF